MVCISKIFLIIFFLEQQAIVVLNFHWNKFRWNFLKFQIDLSFFYSSRKTSKVDETDESTNSSFDPDDNVPEYTSISLDWKKLPSYYMMLSKFRLSMLVAISSTGGYCLAPMPFDIYGLVRTYSVLFF